MMDGMIKLVCTRVSVVMRWQDGFASVKRWLTRWDCPRLCVIMRWQDGFSSVDTCFKCDIAPSMTTLSPGGRWWQSRWRRCSTRWGSVWKGGERVLGHHQFREEEDAWPNSGLWEVWHWQGKHPCSYGVWWSALLHSMSSYIIQGVGIAQWSERWTHDWKGLNACRSGQRSVLTLISVSIPPPCYCSSMWTIRTMDTQLSTGTA